MKCDVSKEKSRRAEEGLKSRQVNYVNISITGIAL